MKSIQFLGETHKNPSKTQPLWAEESQKEATYHQTHRNWAILHQNWPPLERKKKNEYHVHESIYPEMKSEPAKDGGKDETKSQYRDSKEWFFIYQSEG